MAFESNVIQDATIGNPAPSYRLAWRDTIGGGIPTYAARNFGVASATVIEFTSDWRASRAASGTRQAGWGLWRDSSGNGIAVVLEANDADGYYFQLGTAISWADRGSMVTTVIIPLSSLPDDSWARMHIKAVVNSDNTTTVTATVRTTGDVDIATRTATVNIARGDYCGFYGTGGQTGSTVFAWYDNAHVQASGSTGYVPANVATSYVFTFVNDLGEESAPSLPSLTVVRPDGVSATITTPTSEPTGVSTGYVITTKRIYRAATGTTGTAFRFVAEIPLGTADYTDTLTDSELGEVLQSDNWELPPDDLERILALPNGVMAGFSKNQLCLSAQNQPHAWPVAYRLNTDTAIVGIGNIDTTVVIGTESFVYVASGNDPAAYSMAKSEVPYACVSKRSFAYLTRIGVVFAGPNGLMAVAGVGQIQNLTESVFTREQWQALNPSSIRGVAHNSIYWMFWESGSNSGCYAIDMKSDGFGIVPMAFHASAAHVDPITDKLYMVLDMDNEPDDELLPVRANPPHYIDGTTIYQFDASPSVHLTYRYRGKLWLLERPAWLSIMQVKATDYTNILVRLYGDGVLIEEVVIEGETEFTLLETDEYTSLEYEILGTSPVRVVQAAEDVAELT
jgi:hypothetical protein